MNEIEIQDSIRRAALQEAAGGIGSIWIYGNAAQSKLAGLTVDISKMALQNNSESVETILGELVNNINSLTLDDKPHRASARRKSYQSILKCMDELTVQLRLRQAQLLKSLAIYDRMQNTIAECRKELDVYIEVGNEVLADKRKSEVFSSEEIDASDQKYWAERFQRKLEELRTCFVIASQSEVQLGLMKQNCAVLSEKIGASLATTIPIWRNQTALAMGIEEQIEENTVQYKLQKAANQTLKNGNRQIKERLKVLKKTGNSRIDKATLDKLNTQLKVAFSDMAAIERESKRKAEELQRDLAQPVMIQK